MGPPAGFSQSVQTLTSVISTVRRSGSGTGALWSQSWRVELRWGLGGPPVGLGPLRVGESIRLTGAGAQWLALPPTLAARACPRFYARACPRTLGRVAVGIWPYGLWTLAAWRGLICASSRLGVRGYQGRMVSNLPSPCPSTCYRCPDGALWWLASARTIRPSMGFSLIGAFPAFEPRRQGGRECAVRY